MKTKSISMMLIGMMMLSTTTSFGKTNSQPRENNFNESRQEIRVNNNDKGNGYNINRQGMQMNENRTYRMTNNDIRRNEPQPRHSEPRHMDNTTSKVVTGVVVGTVLTGIISSLIK